MKLSPLPVVFSSQRFPRKFSVFSLFSYFIIVPLIITPCFFFYSYGFPCSLFETKKKKERGEFCPRIVLLKQKKYQSSTDLKKKAQISA